MEIQSNVFVPKYLFLRYLQALVYGLGFFYLVIVFIQKGWYGWEYILILTLFGFRAIQDSKELIKEVEFREKEMLIRYYFWGEKVVDYHGIKNINLNFSIVFADVVISLRGMTNSMELQKRVADILGKKRIREINIEKEV